VGPIASRNALEKVKNLVALQEINPHFLYYTAHRMTQRNSNLQERFDRECTCASNITSNTTQMSRGMFESKRHNQKLNKQRLCDVHNNKTAGPNTVGVFMLPSTKMSCLFKISE
jgi:hypothetical protein